MPEIKSAHHTFGAILLVAGCCIGAGMLGLPLVTAASGFLPSTLAFILSWMFMAATGLLLLEANLWYGRGVNLMHMTEGLLGKPARLLVAILFCFLFYCLMVAYLTGGGSIISEFLDHLFGLKITPYVGSLALVVTFSIALFFGTEKVDFFNRILMLGLALTYGGLVSLGIAHMDSSNLQVSEWGLAIPALPAMIISFGYHNLIPSLSDYLDRDVKQLRLTILLGSAIPLFIYLVWDAVILGILPQEEGLAALIDAGAMVPQLLAETVGKSYVVNLMHGFAFFALVTSFLAVAFSFVDFLADGLGVKKKGFGSLFLVGLVLLPPLAFAFLYPFLFLSALNYAGAFGAVILFGMIPIWMVWKGRYSEKRGGAALVPGGKPVLILLFSFALFIFAMQLKLELGL